MVGDNFYNRLVDPAGVRIFWLRGDGRSVWHQATVPDGWGHVGGRGGVSARHSQLNLQHLHQKSILSIGPLC